MGRFVSIDQEKNASIKATFVYKTLTLYYRFATLNNKLKIRENSDY